MLGLQIILNSFPAECQDQKKVKELYFGLHCGGCWDMFTGGIS